MKDPKNTLDSAAEGPWTEAPTRVTRGPLVPCPSCKRHVFASDESTCPFCAAALPLDLAKRAAPSTTKRLSRGETFTFNDAALGAVAGGVSLNQFGPAQGNEPLGGNIGTGLGHGDWSHFGGDPGSSFSMYGAPAPGIGGTDFGPQPNEPHFLEPSPFNPNEDPGGGAAMYGAPADPGGNWGEHYQDAGGAQNEGNGGLDDFQAHGDADGSAHFDDGGAGQQDVDGNAGASFDDGGSIEA